MKDVFPESLGQEHGYDTREHITHGKIQYVFASLI